MSFPVYFALPVSECDGDFHYGVKVFTALCVGYEPESVCGTSIIVRSGDEWMALIEVVSSTGPTYDVLCERIVLQMHGALSESARQLFEFLSANSHPIAPADEPASTTAADGTPPSAP